VQLDRLVLIIKVLLFVTTLSSCAPVPRDFHKPIYEGGTLVSSGCGSSGPPETIVIKLKEGVEIKVRSSNSASNSEFFNFYVKTYISAPDDVALQLDNDFVIIKDNLTDKSWKLKIEYLTTSKQNYLGSDDSIVEITYPTLSQKVQDKIKNSRQDSEYINVTPLSEIVGRTHSYDVAFGGKRYFNTGLWFNVSTRKMKSQFENFSVYLPSIIINGNKINLGEIKFIHVKYIGIDPLNC